MSTRGRIAFFGKLLMFACIGYAASSPPPPAEVATKFKGSEKLQKCAFRFSIDVPEKGKFEAAVKGSSIVAIKDPKAVEAAVKEAATKKQEPKKVKETIIQLSIIAKHNGFPYNSAVRDPVQLEYIETSKSYKIRNARIGMMLFNYESAHYYAKEDAPPKPIDLSTSDSLLHSIEGILSADEAKMNCGDTSMEAYLPDDIPSHVFGLAKKIARTKALDRENKFNCDSIIVDTQDDSTKEKNEAQVQIELRTIKVEGNTVSMHLNLVDKTEEKLYVSTDEFPTLVTYDADSGIFELRAGWLMKHSMTYKNLLWTSDGSLGNTGVLGGPKDTGDYLKLTNALGTLFTKDDSKALEVWRCGTLPAVRSKFQFIVRKVLRPDQFAKLSKQQKLVTGDTTQYTIRLDFISEELKGKCEAHVPLDEIRIVTKDVSGIGVENSHVEFPLTVKAGDGTFYETDPTKPVDLLWEPTNKKYRIKSASLRPVLAERSQVAKGIELASQPGFKAAVEKMLRFDFGLKSNSDFPCGSIAIPYLAPSKVENHLKALQKEIGRDNSCPCFKTSFMALDLENSASFCLRDVKITDNKVSLPLTVLNNDYMDGVTYFESPAKFPTEMTFYATEFGNYEITQPIIQKVSKNEKERDFIDMVMLSRLEFALMRLVEGKDEEARKVWRCGTVSIPDAMLPTPRRTLLDKAGYEAYLKKKQEEEEAKAKQKQAEADAKAANTKKV